jgi:hypothetical protein
MAEEFEFYMRLNGEPVAVKDRTVYTFHGQTGALNPSSVPAHMVEQDCIRITAAKATELKVQLLANVKERFASEARRKNG